MHAWREARSQYYLFTHIHFDIHYNATASLRRAPPGPALARL